MADMRDFHAEELAGAYALGALDPDERLLVDLHIQTCPGCARAVEEAIQAVTLLAHAVDPAVPRPDLEDRLVARLVDEDAPRPRDPVSLGRPVPTAHPAIGRTIVRRLLPIAAALLLVVGVGTWNLQLQGEVAQQQRIVAVMARAEAYSLTPAPGAQSVQGKVFVDHPTGQVLVSVEDLPRLPADRTYQLWLVRPDGHRDNGGTFQADTQGNATYLAIAPASLDSYASLGVTNEPAGGSPGPTGPKVFGCKLDGH
ncbi:MAG TPA: anti-sigma factor [Chloroflexota bacterium]|nr:anti-sigma factor [Chloroflexota bacterium]